jgi:cytochrome c oxidase subunit 1
MGLAGAPRRVFDHPDSFAGWNSLASFGSIISFLSILLLAGPINLVPQTKDTITPSTTTSIEWLLPATPANHTFKQLPLIRS